MPTLKTTHFGVLDYEDQSVIEFATGLPAFEDERRFVLLQRPATEPVVFLQSLQRPDLTFITLPIHLVDPEYRLNVSPEELETLALPHEYQPGTCPETACLTVLTMPEHTPATANLLAPIVINLTTRQARQMIQVDSGYSHQHTLPAVPKEDACS